MLDFVDETFDEVTLLVAMLIVGIGSLRDPSEGITASARIMRKSRNWLLS